MINKIMIVDLECTCDQRRAEDKKEDFIPKVKRKEMEIIEIGAVIADFQGNVFETFSCFVKPVINPVLTDFCKSLTKIEQSSVDNGVSLKEAITMLSDFALNNNVVFWGSWGLFDDSQIKRETNLKNINIEEMYFSELNYINISNEYMIEKKLSRKIGVGKALNREKMAFEGVKHRAVYDAFNTAKLLKCLNSDKLLTTIVSDKFKEISDNSKCLPENAMKILIENLDDLYL